MANLNINSKVLEWLKHEFHQTDADMVKIMGIKDVERYHKIETGSLHPTLRQLRLLSKKFKIPLLAFYIRQLPKNKDLPHDYRSKIDTKLSVKSILAVRRAQLIQSFMSEFEDRQELNLASLVGLDAQTAASSLRESIGYRPADVISKDKLLTKLRNYIESLGIITTALAVKRGDFRGFCLSGSSPVIVMTSGDAAAGQIFTLLHEFFHIIKNQAGICQPGSRSSSADEKECNQFAANFLITLDELDQALTINNSHDDTNLKAIADQHKTSKEVVFIRMIDRRLASWKQYNQRSQRWQQQYQQFLKDMRPRPADPIKKVWRENGQRVTQKVLDQLQKEAISQSEAADYLNVAAGYLDYLGERSMSPA